MRKVIGGKVYDTDKAELLHTYEPIQNMDDFHYILESLYVTPKGAFFLCGEGGPMSAYVQSLGGGSYSGGEGLQVLSVQEAAEWLETHGGDEALIEHESFVDLLEDA